MVARLAGQADDGTSTAVVPDLAGLGQGIRDVAEVSRRAGGAVGRRFDAVRVVSCRVNEGWVKVGQTGGRGGGSGIRGEKTSCKLACRGRTKKWRWKKHLVRTCDPRPRRWDHQTERRPDDTKEIDRVLRWQVLEILTEFRGWVPGCLRTCSIQGRRRLGCPVPGGSDSPPDRACREAHPEDCSIPIRKARFDRTT